MNRLAFTGSLLLLVGCPAPVSLECATCTTDAECAPQGLTCLAGQCATTATQCTEVDAGSEPGDAGVVPQLPSLGLVPDASVMAQDDFEGTTLIGDAGHWDALERAGQVPGQVLSIANDAGIGGSRSFQVIDTSNSNPQFGLVAVKNFPEQQGNFFVRAWVRIASTGATSTVAIAIYSPQVSATVAAEFSVFGVATLKGGSVSSGDPCPMTAAWDDRYHLVELSLFDLGRTTGRATARLDGAAMCSYARDWNGAGIDTLAIGPSYNDPTWQGRMQLDSFVMTRDAPPPAKLVLVAPTPLIAGCLPARVELHDSVDGGLARAVRPTRVEVSVPAFTAADCSGASVRTLNIATGQPAATFFWNVVSGSNPVTVSDPSTDLPPTSTSWTVP